MVGLLDGLTVGGDEEENYLTRDRVIEGWSERLKIEEEKSDNRKFEGLKV
jgi:hypothetical protein